jgi:hypothetical protein
MVVSGSIPEKIPPQPDAAYIPIPNSSTFFAPGSRSRFSNVVSRKLHVMHPQPKLFDMIGWKYG